MRAKRTPKRKEHCSMSNIVNELLSKHPTGNAPLDVFKLCRENGIYLVPYSAPEARRMAELAGVGDWIEKTNAFSVAFAGTSAIFWNDSKTIEYQKAVIAHELGHHLLGHLKEGVDEGSCGESIECQANAFAFLLLFSGKEGKE